jgi:DNA-directed RNA polymerase beta subunit
MLRDIKQNFSKVLSTGAAAHPTTIVQDVRRIIQKCNIENKIKYALATGNWYTNRSQANSAAKKGIAQVVQRLAFSGTTSHLNRITSPLERAGSKHEPPRRLHGSQLPKICPNETPEGAQVGTVKNLALLTHVSIETSAQPVLYCLYELGMLHIEEADSISVHNLTKILVNGDFVGLAPSIRDADRIYRSLVFLKRTGTLSCYISVAWHVDHECIIILTDGGRYSVPYYTIDADNHFKIDNWIACYKERDGSVVLPSMENMTSAIPDDKYDASKCKKVYNQHSLSFDINKEAAIEYLDTNEDETLMLADSAEKLYDGQTYREADNGRFYGHLTLHIVLDSQDLDLKSKIVEKLKQHYNGTKKEKLVDIADNLIQSIMIVDPDQRYIEITLAELNSDLGELQLNLITNLNRFLSKNYIVYTHCLTHPATICGVVATNIPFSDHNQSPRNCYQSSMGKQAIGIYVTNAHLRMDTTSNILAYPHKPVVFSRTAKHTRMIFMHHGFTAMIAIACYGGYNQEDSLLGNRDSAQRGTFNTIYSRTYHNKLQNLANQDAANESFVIPPDNRTIGRKIGAGGDDRYHAIIRNYGKHVGKPKPELPFIGAVVNGNDIIIPKCKSISKKGTETTEVLYSDSSTTVRPSETGVVDMVIPNEDITNNEDEDGHQFCKVRISELRAPEIGDKFASRAAQKGTEGIQYTSADIMFNQDGVCPDKIMNPHGVPSRMTQGMTYEAVCSKDGVLSGKFMDATAFTKYDVETTKDHIAKMGYDYAGDEIMYNGHTGDMFELPIFFNPIYYQRLKHMVTDKMHARNLGPVQSLTKQPAEGRARAGGLRLGEMERDCLIAHGVAQLLKFKLTDDSDIFEVFVSKQKQTVIAANPDMGIYQCGTENVYGEDDVCKMHLPYAMNLFRNELRTSMIDVKLIME